MHISIFTGKCWVDKSILEISFTSERWGGGGGGSLIDFDKLSDLIVLKGEI